MDNEPRNRDTIKRMQKYMDLDYTISFFPDTIKEKDINDMVMAGMSPNKIVQQIDDRTFSGLAALTAYNEWKKV